MASSSTTTALLCFSSPNKPPLSSSPSSLIPLQPQPKGRRSDAAAAAAAAVYVATVPLRASGGPPQMLMSAAHSLGVWDLQHFIVIIKPGDDPSPSQATAFDFQPQDPESIYVALAALSGRQVPGVILKRTLKRLPKRRCWFVGFTHANSVEVADTFSEEWSTDLIVGKHDCRHYTNGEVPKCSIAYVNENSTHYQSLQRSRTLSSVAKVTLIFIKVLTNKKVCSSQRPDKEGFGVERSTSNVLGGSSNNQTNHNYSFFPNNDGMHFTKGFCYSGNHYTHEWRKFLHETLQTRLETETFGICFWK